MPSKRDLLGTDAPSDGPDWSEFRWNRISAFLCGAGVVALYFWVDCSVE